MHIVYICVYACMCVYMCIYIYICISGGTTCLTLPVYHMLSSRVANNVANYGDP